MTKTMEKDIDQHREPDHEIEPILYERWSARAMSGETLDNETLMRLFEAARWAPSSFNRQPWCFRYAARDSDHWQTFLGLLSKGNRPWAQDAAALIVILSRKQGDAGKAWRTHSFDTGAAWQNLALQGTHMGLVVHGMEGFDYDAARKALNVPDEYEVEAMVAVGAPGPVEALPEKYQDREKPSVRKPAEEIAKPGPFS